jgi:hypothetical protein
MDITREQLTEAVKNNLGAGDGPGLEHLVSAMWRELGQGAVDTTLAQARQAALDGNSQAAAGLYEQLDSLLGSGYPLPPAWGTRAERDGSAAAISPAGLLGSAAALLEDGETGSPHLTRLVVTVLRNLSDGREMTDRLPSAAPDLVTEDNSTVLAAAADLLDAAYFTSRLAKAASTVLRRAASGAPLASEGRLDPGAQQDLLSQAMGAARSPAQQGMAALAYLARMDSGPLDEAISAFHGGHRERLAHALEAADPEAPPFVPDGQFARRATEGQH